MGDLGLIVGALFIILLSILWRQFVSQVWRPYAVSKKLRKQGVKGPVPKLLSGCADEMKSLETAARGIVIDTSSHEILPRVLPHYFKWINQYGGTFQYRIGSESRLCITDPELTRQVLSNKYGFYTKAKPLRGILDVMGRGLVFAEGAEWARHRRIVSPAFAMDKLKMMVKAMADCTVPMLENWQNQIALAGGRQVTIEVGKHFHKVTADVIAHAAFGSSYNEGIEVFLAQQQLFGLTLATCSNMPIPGLSYLPTKINKQKWKLTRKIHDTLVKIIEGRLKSNGPGYGNDLLGLMLESTQKEGGKGLSMTEIVDECKTFFFAGHETNSQLVTWTMFLLSTNQEWQAKIRDEVLSECGATIPTPDSISKLKLLPMVIWEALRLYSPVPFTLRVASKDMNLGGLTVPKGMVLSIPFAVIHQSKEVWGEDAGKFNPLRFQDGVGKAAKHPNAMLAFSVGPRTCVGQDFSILEARTIVAMILQKFSFSLSSEYKHMPTNMITLQPQEGLPIVLKPLLS